MFNSKFYFFMILLTLLASIAALALQLLELQQYGVIEQLLTK